MCEGDREMHNRLQKVCLIFGTALFLIAIILLIKMHFMSIQYDENLKYIEQLESQIEEYSDL